MDRLYGGVCYAGIDTDPELKYPKGAGRVAFSNQQSYIAAISARFVQLQHGDIEKRVRERTTLLLRPETREPLEWNEKLFERWLTCSIQHLTRVPILSCHDSV